MITEVTLKNFKCFADAETLQLSKVNLFAGCNGRGKSTFMQSLLLLAQSLDSEKRLNHLSLNGRFVSLGTYNDVKSAFSNDKPSISFKTDDAIENELLISFKEYKDKPQWGNLVRFSVSGRELVEEMGSADGEETGRKLRSLGVTSTVAGLSQLYNVYYIAADRKGPVDYVQKNDNRDDNQIGVHGEFLINSLANKGSDFVEQVRKATSKILSGASLSVADTGTDYLRFYLDSADGSKGFRPTNVGFGYSYVLPIIITALMAEKGSKLFIENPEAHLHPGAQSRLMDFLVRMSSENNLQLFIETHSDHIINALRIAVASNQLNRNEAEIVYFSRGENNRERVSQIKIDSRGGLSDYPDGFMDEWAMQMSQLV